MDNIHKRIKDLRTSLHMTQEELAEKVGYTDRSMIAKIEKGIVDLPLTKVKSFADALHTDIYTLTGMDERLKNCETFTVDENGESDYVVHVDENEFQILYELNKIPKVNKEKAFRFIRMYLDSLK